MKTIEKKQYINPSMEVIEINAPQIMAGSPQLGGEYEGGDPVYSRESDFDEGY